MQNTKKKQISVKDKLEDTNLDLSLMELTEVPVREMTPLTRASNVDLSNNKLTMLPANFATLTFIVKLDLSRNQLHELPENFGQLRNLRHLDLFSNQLERLPVSFHQLTQLRWLDLKNNPLVPSLAAAAGECLDTKGCQAAAKNVVKLMEMAKEELDKQHEKKLQQEKAREAAKRAKEAREQEKLRLQKKAEKERRKAESRAFHSQKVNGDTLEDELHENKNDSTRPFDEKEPAKTVKAERKGTTCCGRLFRWMLYTLLMATFFATLLIVFHWEGPYSKENFEPAAKRALKSAVSFKELAAERSKPLIKQWDNMSRIISENTGETIRNGLETTKHYLNVGWKHTSQLCSHYWAIAVREAPVYYRIVLDKVTDFSKSFSGDNSVHTKKD